MIFAMIIKAAMIQFRFDSFQWPTGDMKRYYVHQIQQKKSPTVSSKMQFVGDMFLKQFINRHFQQNVRKQQF